MQEIPILTYMAAAAAGIGAACLALLVFDLLQMVELEKTETEDMKRLPIQFRIFMPLVPNTLLLARAEALAGHRKQCQDLLLMAGYDQAINAEQFIAIRILMLVAGAGFAVLTFFAKQPMMGLLVLALAFLYPMAWLRRIVKTRHLEILKALPNVLDLLTLSVEAGKDFLTALRDIVGRRRMDALGEELSRTLHEIQLGKQRQRALKEMSERVQQPELSSVINAIIQADELGVSIGQLLRIQGDQLRNKRFARAEKLANEAPVKILGPVIIFIFPSVIIILMAPIIMQAMKTLLK